MKQYILVLLVVIFSGASSRAASLAVSADSAYMAEDYLRAIDLYEQSLAQESRSADTYYNLANAYWRNGNAGRAIINYERALQQNPAHEDARVNLDFVRTRIQDLPEDDSSFLGNLHDGIIAWMSPDAWAWTALILFVAVAAMAALYIFAGSVLLRKTGFFGGIALLCLCVYAINVDEYLNLKVRHPDKLIGVQVGNYMLFYGKDAEAAAPALGTKLPVRDIPGLGKTSVTGYNGAWQVVLKRLLEHGQNVLV